MIPSYHPTFPFPYNLEDRIKDTIKKINKIINRKIDIKVNKMKNGIFLDDRNLDYKTLKTQLQFFHYEFTTEGNYYGYNKFKAMTLRKS